MSLGIEPVGRGLTQPSDGFSEVSSLIVTRDYHTGSELHSMRFVVGLEAFAYRDLGMRPARNALRPAQIPSRIASAIRTGSRARAIALFTSRPWQPSSMATAA